MNEPPKNRTGRSNPVDNGTHGRRPVGARLPLLCATALLAVLSLQASWAARQVSAGDPTNLSRSAGPSSSPTLAAGAGGWMAVWEENDALWYTLNARDAWSPPGPVPAAAGSSPALAAAPDGSFDLVWSSFSETDSRFEILHSRYAGTTWSLPERVAETPGQSHEPDVAVAPDGARLVVWAESMAAGTVLYAAHASVGGDWEHGPLTDAAGTSPSVAFGAGAWHLAWAEDVDGDRVDDLLYRRGGATGWSTPDVVAMGGPAVADPSLAVDGTGTPAMAWLSDWGAVSFSRLAEGAWSAAEDVDGRSGASGSPSLAFDSAGFGIGWARLSDVLVSYADDGGWSEPTIAMSLGDRARAVAVAARAGAIGLVAEGNATGGHGDVFYVDAPRSPAPATPAATVTATGTAAQSPTGTVTHSPTGTVTHPPTGPATAVSTPTAPPDPRPTASLAPSAGIYLPLAERAPR